ncbi:MAG: hypothetical protein ACHQZQ_00390 [SAR324 cluster bacterium]
MEANALTAAAKGGRPGQPGEAQRVIQLVSNAPSNKIVGLDGFLKAFNSKSVRAEVTTFRYVIQRRARRSLGGRYGKGLSQEVTENVEVNPNDDLFALRRWLGGIRQDPSCVMLLNVFKVRDDALAAPLIFSEMIRTGRPILVTGATPEVQDQLLTQIDLTFQRVPPNILANLALRNSLEARAQRKKGFVATVRPVLELEGLPPQLAQKLQAINGGQDATLNEAELINVCLLGDLATRYLPTIHQFREAMRNNALQLPQLVTMFEILTSDMELELALEAFKEFFTEETQGDLAKIRSRAAVFSEVYRAINNTEAGTRATNRQERMVEFFRKLAGVVIRFRARADPAVWRRCHFLGELHPAEHAVINQLLPFHALLCKRIESGQEETGPEFMSQLGAAVFDLVEAANRKPETIGGETAILKQAAAARILPLFRLNKFSAPSLVHISEANRATLLNKEKFLSLFRKIPVSLGELKELEDRLHGVLYVNEHMADAVRKTTLDVMLGHARERERKLREIYILSAVPELVNYNFHMGQQAISPVERMAAFAVAGNRLGLELRTEPVDVESIALYVLPDEPKLGALSNDPMLVSRAYTALTGLQVERIVRRVVDHKINYLQSMFGDNFFETIYEAVVDRHDIPLSRNELAWFVQRRGLLGNLQAKGWRPEEENTLDDGFITVEIPAAPGQKPVLPQKDFSKFPQRFKELSEQFAALLERLKTQAEADPEPHNPAVLIWQLYQQGNYNLSQSAASDALRKSVFYDYLKDIIAQISSENYSTFTREIQQEGVKIFVPRSHSFLLSIGSRFGFLIAEKVVRYQLLASPAESKEQLDLLSRVFFDSLEKRFAEANPLPDVKALRAMGEEIKRCNALWWDYSRYVAFALVDRVLSETIVAQLRPGHILPPNLWYLPDESKLCLGPAVTTSDLVPFQKILQVPENMGNILKNPKSSSSTVDEFTTEVHKIQRLKDELENLSSIAADVLDILQNLTHSRTESALVQKYEVCLAKLIEILATPLRHFSEKEVQLLHLTARTVRETLQAFYQTPGSTKDQLIGLLQNHLRGRRSDGLQLKLTFTDTFILETTEIKVMQKVKKEDGAVVTRQKKMEVEVDQTYQTIATRMRDVIRAHELLARKDHIVFQPEGQKRKQIEYVLDIIDTMRALRGQAPTFYCDMTMLDEGQIQELATRIKPHNFFKIDELKNEPPKGTADRARDPLSGRPVAKKPAEAVPAGQAAKNAPAAPSADFKSSDGKSAEPALASGLRAREPQDALPAPSSKPASVQPPAKPVPAAAAQPVQPSLAAGMQPRSARDARPAVQPPAAQDQIYASRSNPDVRYRFDAAQGAYFFLDPAGPVPARAVPVALDPGPKGAVLMCKLRNGKFVCHGLYGGDVLLPLQQKPAPPTLFSFAFPGKTVRVVNEGGKAAVRVDPA